MRISEFLRASFVGALLFSPAMADEIEQVHEEALRVLREKMALPAAPSAATPAASAVPGDSEAARLRAEREARIKAEAQQIMAERERLQMQRRAEFEQFVKERERLRQEQRVYDQNVARQTGVVAPAESNDVHAQALQVLHQMQNGAASPAVAPAPAVTTQPASVQPAPASDTTQRALEILRENRASTPAAAPTQPTEAEVAPRVVAAGTPPALQSSSTDVHEKALEELRRQTQGATSASSGVSSPDSTPAPTPSPELQRRLKEMQAELESPRPTSTISEEYVRDLEQRALQSAGSTTTVGTPQPAAAPALDARTREILQRQDREISQGGTIVTAPSQPATARSAEPNPVPAVASSHAATPPARPAPATSVSEPDYSSAQYSRELEERARQIIMERAQAQSAAAPVAATPVPYTQTPTYTPPRTTNPTPTFSTPPTTAPSTTATPESVHDAALQTLNQIQTGAQETRPLAKTKMQRLKEITDAYRADLMGPAEYHQKRAAILAEPNP